jgi:hypothetical protein
MIYNKERLAGVMIRTQTNALTPDFASPKNSRISASLAETTILMNNVHGCLEGFRPVGVLTPVLSVAGDLRSFSFSFGTSGLGES